MAIYRAQVFKRLATQEHEWSNVYHIRAATISGAAAQADLIAGAEESFHYNNVFFTRVRVSQEGVPGTFTIVTLNTPGIGGDPLDQIPLWNVVRASFNVLYGRPSFKFYRLPLREQDQTNGVITAPIGANIIAAMEPYLATGTDDGLVDEDGNLFTTVTVDTLVHERQLHRRRRRRVGTGGLV